MSSCNSFKFDFRLCFRLRMSPASSLDVFLSLLSDLFHICLSHFIVRQVASPQGRTFGEMCVPFIIFVPPPFSFLYLRCFSPIHPTVSHVLDEKKHCFLQFTILTPISSLLRLLPVYFSILIALCPDSLLIFCPPSLVAFSLLHCCPY